MQISLSSNIVPIIEGFRDRAQDDDSASSLSGRYDIDVSFAFWLINNDRPYDASITAKKIVLDYEGLIDDYRIEITGKGLSPIRSVDRFLDALDDGIAKGELDRLRIIMDGKTIFQINLSDRSMEMRSGPDYIKVSGKLPDTFQEVTRLAEYLSRLDLLLGGGVTAARKKEIIKDLSAFGLHSVSLGSGKTEIMKLGMGEKAVSLTLDGLTIRVNGSFGNDFGDLAARMFKIVGSFDEDFLPNPLSVVQTLIAGFAVSSVSFGVKGKSFLHISDFDGETNVVKVDGVPLPEDAGVVFTELFLTASDDHEVIFTSSDNDTVDGLGGNDTIYGYDGNDSLSGGDGDDRLFGGGGNDTMAGGAGNDTFYATSGDVITDSDGAADTVFTAQTHTLADGIENLVLLGKAHLRATGNALDNAITGNAGNNVIDGGAGNDTMRGGAGNDSYLVDSSGDVVTEAGRKDGVDTVTASVSYALGAHVERLVLSGDADLAGTGNGLDNRITGNQAANVLTGMAGNDTVTGGAGNDTILGGVGGDRLVGGDGADVFRFLSIRDSTVTATGRDMIVRFNPDEDVIDLSAIDARSRTAADDAFTFIGRSQFSGVAGQLRFADGALTGDTNGDRRADFRIDIGFDDGFTRLAAADLLL